MGRMKQVGAGCLAVALCFLLHTAAWADKAARLPEGSGSITIHMKDVDSGAAVPGGTLRCGQVAQPASGDGNEAWVYLDAFADCGALPDDLSAAGLAARIADCARQQPRFGRTVTVGQDASAVFSDLSVGLYLVVQDTAAPGYHPVEPFLVAVPSVMGGVLVYHVDATPKLELKQAPPSPNTAPMSVSPQKPTPQPPLPSKLPQTGQLWWPVPLLLAIGLVLIVWGMRKSKPLRP